jgi:hypothetical protein
VCVGISGQSHPWPCVGCVWRDAGRPVHCLHDGCCRIRMCTFITVVITKRVHPQLNAITRSREALMRGNGSSIKLFVFGISPTQNMLLLCEDANHMCACLINGVERIIRPYVSSNEKHILSLLKCCKTA